MGRVGGAVARTRIGAPIAQQAAKVTGKVSALRNTPIPAAGQPGRAAAIGKKAAGLVIEEGSQGAVAGALTAYVLEDPWSGNLSNALKGTPLESPFSRWTQTGPNDSSQEARFKNAVTDFVYGIPFGIGLGAAGDAIKAATGGDQGTYAAATRLGGDTIQERNAFELGESLLSPKTRVEDVKIELGPNPSAAQIEAAKRGIRTRIDQVVRDHDSADSLEFLRDRSRK
jgi:hypothetical protein